MNFLCGSGQDLTPIVNAVNPKVKVKISDTATTEEVAAVIEDKLSGVIDLGTGTSFDIKSLFPNDYARLTASNFLVTDVMSFDMGHTTNDLMNGGRYWCQNTARATVNKSYNATSGVFTCTCNGSNGISGIHLSADSPNFGNYASAVSFTPHVYLILGKITTV